MIKFAEDRWLGNQWASIDIEPVDASYFLPILSYLMNTYNFPQPHILEDVDGYVADFKIDHCNAIIKVDTWTFSIAFDDEAMRNRVLEAFQQLPDDYFDA